jgi:hypothetical protein
MTIMADNGMDGLCLILTIAETSTWDLCHLLMSMSFFYQVAKAGIAGAHATIMLFR